MVGLHETMLINSTPIVAMSYGGSNGRILKESLIEAIARAKGVDPLELSPLYDTVDLDAVGRLLEPHAEAETTLGFAIDQYSVFVSANGEIRVFDRTKPTESRRVFER